MIDLRRLQVLRVVAERGTVTAAAEALHVTPSAASHQIRQLGRELGVPLLEPDGRGVRLTPAARGLLRHADTIAEEWERARAELHGPGEPSGPLDVRAIPTALAAIVGPAAAALHRAHPALDVHVAEAEPAEGFDLLLTGATDLTVYEPTARTPPLTDPRFRQRPLLRDPFDLLVPRGHPLDGRGGLALADAAREPWILETAPSSSREHTVAACTAAGFRPRVAHEARQWAVVAALVAQGLGVALVPRLARLPADLPVVRVPPAAGPAPERQLLTAVRRGSEDHPSVAAAHTALLHHASRTDRPG